MKHATFYGITLAAMLLLLTACSDPEKSAQNTIAHVKSAMATEKADLDPQKQLDAYETMVKQVALVGKKYSRTPTGRAIADGRSVDGVSLASVTALRDALAPRATCYANPDVVCLSAFSSHPNGNPDATSPRDAFAEAEHRVCSEGFAAADKSLDAIKINRQAYAQDLVQVALTAAKCHRPADVKAAVAQYIKATPAQSGAQTSALLSVLATDALKPAWPMVMTSLESALTSGRMDRNETANTVLSLAIKYARMGNAKAALAKYATFTQTLHYQADANSTEKLVSALILDGDAATALKMAAVNGDQNATAVALHRAGVALGARMGLTQDALGASPNMYGAEDIQSYFLPVTGPMKPVDEAAANALEKEIDALAPVATRSNQTVGDIGLDTDYGVLALVHQKLGAPAKASAAIKKAVDFRKRLLGSVDAGNDYTSFAQYATLVAIAQNHLSDAAQYVKTARLSSDEYGHLLMLEAGRTQDAANALAIANTIGAQRDLWHCYSDIIPQMAKAGKMTDIQQLIDAWSGNPAQKRDFHGWLVDGMVAAGNADGARRYAQSHHLADTPTDKLRLDVRLLASKQIARNRARAEPLIRDMFAIGQGIDQAGGISHGGGYYMHRYTDNYIAQNAARTAFENGYVDLGIELYQKASNKDQRPLLAAFAGKLSKTDMTRLLMLAQNNVAGQGRAYVVDQAIRHLQGRRS